MHHGVEGAHILLFHLEFVFIQLYFGWNCQLHSIFYLFRNGLLEAGIFPASRIIKTASFPSESGPLHPSFHLPESPQLRFLGFLCPHKSFPLY